MRGVLHQVADAFRRAAWMQRTVLVSLHVLSGTILVVCLGALLLWLLQTRVVGTETAAARVRIAELGVVVILALVFLLLWAWLHPILKLAGRRRRDAFWLAAVVVCVLAAFLSSRKPPDATVAGFVESITANIGDFEPTPGYDIVLLLDPSDPGARRLVRDARERPSTLRTSLPAAANRGVRFAIVVAQPARPMPRFRVQQRLTADRDAVVRALAAVSIERNVASAAESYAHAIAEVAVPGFGWRPTVEHAIVLVADRLPGRRELDAVFDRYVAKLPRELREDISEGGVLSTVSAAFAGVTVPHSWAFRSSKIGLSLSVVTTTTSSPHLGAWHRWTGGEVLLPRHFNSARSALDVAELAVVGAPTRRLQRLAEKYRPFLFFDSEEEFGVLNVDDLLRERDTDGKQRHRICEHHWGPQDDECRPIRSAEDFRPDDDYIDFGGTPSDKSIHNSGVIYYEVVPKRERLQIAYWWFFRYNESPVWSRFNCLAGLAIAEATCFDHEGDWEGVTVTLDKQTERPKSVTYYGHGWPGYRFTWGALKGFGSSTGDHPHVYVAFGSHASYPVPCDLPGMTCKQFNFEKFGQILPDGRHDGGVSWYGNEPCTGCVQPLPVDSRGEPMSWNRFAGRWGASECTRIAKMCLKVEGPRSPSEQPRVVVPAPPEDLDLKFLRAFAGR